MPQTTASSAHSKTALPRGASFAAGMSLAMATLVLIGLGSVSHAASETDISEEEAAYRRAIADRASRIVSALRLDEADVEQRVTTLVADQYRALRDEHDSRDSSLEEADGEEKRVVRLESDRRVMELHRRFVARLSTELDADGVVGVKNGMTYGVVPITLAAYHRLLPDLSEEQRRTLRAHLTEAREYAMDAGSSKEKHGWFGKYKGRINNYLSAEGYDLKQAERDLAARSSQE
ncbi:hypothetical protein Mal64_14390 [Pseudobythopirellula maris]|uniref:DUF3826 domain-containing protein n=1 Tax=Pseudobythopirellula maris TaxID=2527991 RepID=A0A5C5ZUX6_9BACT|nr:DUF3826 domain-containing protein [Pseudobythopirellula maris]TWT91040.1 hypothetical protein Mal64_14390 [Pseudobythopirellula maris]